MNKLISRSTISKAQLSNAHWLESLLQLATQHGLLSETEQRSIRRQLLEVLEFMAMRYTAGASTSVRVETAQSLMACASYSIAHTLKRLPTADAALAALRGTPIRTLFDRGQTQLRELLEKTKAQYAALLSQSMPLQSRTWTATLHEGLGTFFSAHHVYDAAHDTPGLIDYPTAVPMDDSVGIEFIARYIKRLKIEDSFTRRWSADEINGLLRTSGGIEAPVNIFLLVLTNAMGALLCQRRPDSLSLSSQDRALLRERLSELTAAPLKRLLRATAEALCKGLGIQDTATTCYASDVAALLAPSVRNALQTGTLSRVFLTIKAAPVPVLFRDAPRMSDEQFRVVTADITECRFPEDRVALVKQHVKSIADMVDLFEARCLTAADLTAVLQTLGDDALAMLLHLCREYPSDTLHTNDAEALWRGTLKKHIGSMDDARQKSIRRLSKNIRFM